MKSRLLFLWSIVGLFVLGTGIGLTWFYAQVQREEFARNQRDATLDDKHRARRNALRQAQGERFYYQR